MGSEHEAEQFFGRPLSSANLIQAEATARELVDIPLSDTTIREKILSNLKKQLWAHTTMLNVTVNAGVGRTLGMAESACRAAIKVAAESTVGVCAVNDNWPPVPPRMRVTWCCTG